MWKGGNWEEALEKDKQDEENNKGHPFLAHLTQLYSTALFDRAGVGSASE